MRWRGPGIAKSYRSDRLPAPYQRTARVALNAVHRALDTWAAAVAEGKGAATQLSNVLLTAVHLPALPLGVLADVPGLLPASNSRLQERQWQQLAVLACCTERLAQAVADLQKAATRVAELAEAEAVAPVLGPTPVFAGLPLDSMSHMLLELQSMHAAELEVKQQVMAGFRQLVERQASADGDGDDSKLRPHGSASVAGGGGRERQRISSADHETLVRRRCNVYLCAWLLSPEVDDDTVAAHLAALGDDMLGF